MCKEGILHTGIPTEEELARCGGIPSRQRMEQGPVAVIECLQCIPCNPCKEACPAGAIRIGETITDAPVLDIERCVGCGQCIAACPGLAITVADLSRKDGQAELAFPFEFLPLPAVGDLVDAVDRAGAAVCRAAVLSVDQSEDNQGTSVIRIRFPAEHIAAVKSIRRLAKEV